MSPPHPKGSPTKGSKTTGAASSQCVTVFRGCRGGGDLPPSEAPPPSSLTQGQHLFREALSKHAKRQS